jgi:hypothetical protein
VSSELLKIEIVASSGADGLANRRTQVIRPQLLAEAIPVIKSLCEDLLGKLGTEEESVIQRLFLNRTLREGPNPIDIFDES